MPTNLETLNANLETSRNLWGGITTVVGTFGVKLASINYLWDTYHNRVVPLLKRELELHTAIGKAESSQERLERGLQAEQIWFRRNIRQKDALRDALRVETSDEKKAKIQKQLDNLLDSMDVKRIRRRDLERQIAEQVEQQAQLEGKLPMARFERHMGVATAQAAPLVLAFSTMAKATWDFNRALIQANSNLDARNNLFRSALTIQVKTGIEMQTLERTYEALRAQGQLYYGALGRVARTSQDFRATLGDPRVSLELKKAATAVAMLHEGLGVSVETGAELVAISRTLGVSFQQLGDTIATVVDNTSLTGQEVANIAKQIGRMAYGYGQRGADVSGATRMVAALQDQLNQLGVEGRDVAVNLVTGLSDIRKLGGLGMAFGATPGLAGQGPERIRQVVGNVGRFLQQFQGNQWVFPQMAEMFGMTVDQARALIDSLPKLAQAESQLQQNRINLEERFRNQSNASGKVIGQFTSSLRGLLLEALNPLLPAIQTVTTWINNLREVLAEIPDPVKAWAGWVTIGAGALLGASAVIKFTAGLWGLRGTGVLGRLVGLGGAAGGQTEAALGGVGRAGMMAFGRAALQASIPAFASSHAILAPVIAAAAGAAIPLISIVAVYKWGQVFMEYMDQKEKLKRQAEQMAQERAQAPFDTLQRRHEALVDLMTGRTAGGPAAFGKQLKADVSLGRAMVARGQLTGEQFGEWYQQQIQMLETRRRSDLIKLNIPEMYTDQQRAEIAADNEQIIALLKEIAGHSGDTAKTFLAVADAGKKAAARTQEAISHAGEMPTLWEIIKATPLTPWGRALDPTQPFRDILAGPSAWGRR